MNISKNKIQIAVILLIVVSIFILSLIKKENMLVTNNSNNKINVIKKTKEINDIPTITYIVEKNISGYDDKKNHLTYDPVDIPQIVNTNNNQIWNKVNQVILDDYKDNFCDPKEYPTTANISDIYYNWGATITFMNKHLLSLDVSTGSYCGGAHPNVYTYGLKFNLDKWREDKGRQIDFSDIFRDYAKDKIKIKDIVLTEVMKGYDVDMIAECKAEIESNYGIGPYKESDIEPFAYSFNADGLMILSFGLPHAIANCEPSSTLVTYESLSPYIKANFLEMLK